MDKETLKGYLMGYVMYGTHRDSFKHCVEKLRGIDFDYAGLMEEVIGVVEKRAKEYVEREEKMDKKLLEEYLLDYVMYGTPEERFATAITNLNESGFDRKGLISEILKIIEKRAREYVERRENGRND